MNSIVNSQEIRIQPGFEELESIIINNSDTDKWPREAVLCHNDLTPRELILSLRASSGGKSKYKLAGIIDWELAWLYPASYEVSLEDTYLGANRHVSFYLLLKEYMKTIVARSSPQIVLLQAMELIFESQQRLLSDGTNIPAHIRKKFMESSKLARGNNPYIG
jgi:thiamine kinase-like enzyme